jgi:Ca2+-binding EF-hand superfamily protein
VLLKTRLVGMLALFLAIVGFLGPLAAGDAGKKGKDIDAIFLKLDVNKDGRLSKDEFLKIAERFRDKDKARLQLAQTFDKLDPDRKGLSKDQFRTFVEASNKKKEEQSK